MFLSLYFLCVLWCAMDQFCAAVFWCTKLDLYTGTVAKHFCWAEVLHQLKDRPVTIVRLNKFIGKIGCIPGGQCSYDSTGILRSSPIIGRIRLHYRNLALIFWFRLKRTRKKSWSFFVRDVGDNQTLWSFFCGDKVIIHFCWLTVTIPVIFITVPAALLGLVYIVAREIYFVGYSSKAEKRYVHVNYRLCLSAGMVRIEPFWKNR